MTVELLSPKQYSYLRPSEKFAYDNREGFEVKNFLGSGRWATPIDFKNLDDAVAYAAKLSRPMIYAFAHRATGERCVCFVR